MAAGRIGAAAYHGDRDDAPGVLPDAERSGTGLAGFPVRESPGGPRGRRLQPRLQERPGGKRADGPVVQLHKELIAERLINLDYIEQNRWQLFQVSHGRITTRPSGWE